MIGRRDPPQIHRTELSNITSTTMEARGGRGFGPRPAERQRYATEYDGRIYTSDEESEGEDDYHERAEAAALSKRHGEAEEVRSSAAGDKRPAAAAASTEEEIAAEYGRAAKKKKKRAPRPALKIEDLTGADGLIRIPTEFSNKVRCGGKRRGGGSSSGKVEAAAAYTRALFVAYRRFCDDLFPSAAFEDVLLKIEQLGSKKEVKSYLQNMRQDACSKHVERIYGRERAERMLSELEQGLLQQQQQPFDEGGDCGPESNVGGGAPEASAASSNPVTPHRRHQERAGVSTASGPAQDKDGVSLERSPPVVPLRAPRPRRGAADEDDDDEAVLEEMGGAPTAVAAVSGAAPKRRMVFDDDDDSSDEEEEATLETEDATLFAAQVERYRGKTRGTEGPSGGAVESPSSSSSSNSDEPQESPPQLAQPSMTLQSPQGSASTRSPDASPALGRSRISSPGIGAADNSNNNKKNKSPSSMMDSPASPAESPPAALGEANLPREGVTAVTEESQKTASSPFAASPDAAAEAVVDESSNQDATTMPVVPAEDEEETLTQDTSDEVATIVPTSMTMMESTQLDDLSGEIESPESGQGRN
jgi:hypothetical protein